MQLNYCRKCYAETAEIDDVAEEDIHNFVVAILSEPQIKLIIGLH